MTASIHGGECGSGKRSKSVFNLRAPIIYFGSIRIKANTLLEMLGIGLGTTSYKPKAISLSYGGSMPRQFLDFVSRTLRV